MTRSRSIGPVEKIFPDGPSICIQNDAYPAKIGMEVYADSRGDLPVMIREEVMEDEPSPPPPTGFKPCRHNSVTGSWYPRDTVVFQHEHHDAKVPNGVVTYNFAWSTLLRRFQFTGFPDIAAALTSNDWSHDDFWRLSHAWESMKPSIEPSLDLLVFLAEADELPKLFMSLKEKLGKILLSDAGDVLRYIDGLKILRKSEGTGGMLKVVLSESADSLSNDWLEYNFALKPTVNELLGIIQSLLTFRKKLEDLLAGANKPQKAHKSFTTTEEMDSIEDVSICAWGTNCEGGGKCPYTHADTYDEATGRRWKMTFPGGATTRIGMTVYYRYSLPDWVSGLEGSIRAFCSSLGLSPGLGTIWELIPFSFVLDWIYPLGSLLDRIKLDATPVKTELLDICFTRRLEHAFHVEGVPYVCKRNSPVPICTGKVVKYDRVVGANHLTMIPSFRWPNWFQLSLGAALGNNFRRW